MTMTMMIVLEEARALPSHDDDHLGGDGDDLGGDDDDLSDDDDCT